MNNEKMVGGHSIEEFLIILHLSFVIWHFQCEALIRILRDYTPSQFPLLKRLEDIVRSA